MQEQKINFISENNGKELKLNTSSLSQGVYFLEICFEKEKTITKFIKD